MSEQMPPYEEQYFIDTSKPVWNYSLFTDDDIKSYQYGTHCRLYKLFGNKQITVLNTPGTYFAVWAPNARYVSVIGDFNHWNKDAHKLIVRQDSSGIWEGFIPNVAVDELYKYCIITADNETLYKADPFANFAEKRPKTASITHTLNYNWQDDLWMKKRKKINALNAPFSIYEVHLASWMRPDKYNEESYNTYLNMIDLLVPYVKELGFTHVEFMPVMEHPFDGSWGYQGTGFFAATSRFGKPEDLMKLIDTLHNENIGVILDWVPSHFPADAHGLYRFDGEHTYEYADMRKGFHPDWNSYIFNYSRGEVRSFLLSSAHFWCDRFHADGIRVDAVSSVLRLDYSREEGQWEANIHGGNGNLEAIDFIKLLNETLYRDFPDIQTIAEESTDWSKISKPTFEGGMGFGMKWMMGWMHDTLKYFKREPVYRPYHQNDITFSMAYFYDENFMLPLSHDEVVHGKSPMLYKMPGDDWQKFANLRLLYSYMFLHPGAKLLFMGNEFAATGEWNYKSELQWDLLMWQSHQGMKECVKALNKLYREENALYEKQFEHDGFEWIDLKHESEAVLAFKRKGLKAKDDILVILNMLPEVRWNWKINVFGKTKWTEIFNSDSQLFWGTDEVYNPNIDMQEIDKAAKYFELNVHLPALSAVVLK
ncbi:1,4-alpha-glucan branching protein GlgB [Arachidicoccus ginsenosidimutans]|uniref:1,4-alpha-glucan branching protein GlgB n=1 Tax=Arachidicoccus sp. BS20 TaxID=1850526 RepID=UPI0009EECCD9|nr:1,4-alpha-glucan branching protein GlgB [Arachidicoccus sp. BS20]